MSILYYPKVLVTNRMTKNLLKEAGGLNMKIIEVPPQIMTSYDRIANERPVYTVIDQW